jgi:hypothetical protein
MPILIRNGSSTIPVSPRKFSSEEELELILQDCPQLLCDDSGPPQEKAPGIAFVARQVNLPEAGRLDLLFVSNDGLPIAVEVKHVRNAQARREILAQAVDYVSSLTAMTVDELDQLVDGRLEKALYQLTLDDITQFESLWRNVGTNLRAGRARLIMALDDSTPPLERIFHFLTRSSNLDIQLLIVQLYPSSIREIFVSRARVSQAAEHQSDDEGPKVRYLRASDDDARVITLLVTDNPKRVGSAARERFTLYRSGMTVGQFLAAGGLRADISWDVDHGFIRLDDPRGENQASSNND